MNEIAKTGQDRGQVEDRPVDRDLADLLVHRQGQEHRDDHPDRDREQRVVERVVGGLPEQRVGGHPGVVLDADEDRSRSPEYRVRLR